MKKILILVGLVFLNIATAFVLNIFSNKITDLINISPGFLIIVTIITISISVTLELYLNYKTHLPNTTFSFNFRDLLINRVVTIFPLSIGLGVFCGYVFFFLIPQKLGFIFHVPYLFPWHYKIYNYEILSFIIGSILIYALSRTKNSVSLTSTFAIGFGSTIGIVFFLLYRPPTTYSLLTDLVTWNVLFISVVVILHTDILKKIGNIFSQFFDFLLKTH